MTDSTSVFTAVLTELGWKPEVLARKLNSVAALHGRPERVHAKTPYKWLRGDRPRFPLARADGRAADRRAGAPDHRHRVGLGQ